MSTATTCAESAMDNGTGLASVLAVDARAGAASRRLPARPARDVLQRRGMGAHRLGAICEEPERRRARQDRAQRQPRFGGGQPEPRGADAAAMPASSRSCWASRRPTASRAHRAAADDQLRPCQLRPGRHPCAAPGRGLRRSRRPSARRARRPPIRATRWAQGELRTATLFTAALVAAACNADPAEAEKWRSR